MYFNLQIRDIQSLQIQLQFGPRRINLFKMEIQLKTSQVLNKRQNLYKDNNQASDDQPLSQIVSKDKLDVFDLQHGPYEEAKRECKDVFCFFLYWLNTLAMIILSAWAYFTGTPSDIYRATDSMGNICGKKNSPTQNYRYAYFYNPTTQDLSKRVCLQYCPTTINAVLQNFVCYPTGPACLVNVTINEAGQANPPLVANGNYFIGYKSSAKIDRICLPDQHVLKNALRPYSQNMAEGLIQSKLLDFISDVQNNYGWLFAMAAVAIFFSVINWLGLRFLPVITIWANLIITIALFITIGFVFLYNGGALTVTDQQGRLGIPTNKDRTFYTIYGAFCLSFTVLTIVVFICCFHQLGPTIQMVRIAGKFFKSLPSSLIIVLLMTIMMYLFWMTAISSIVYALSASDYSSTSQNLVFTQVAKQQDRGIIMLYYFIFNAFWTHEIFITTMVFSIASCVSMWYFHNGPVEQMNRPFFRTFLMIMRYHFGSLVFGSLVLLVVQFLQFILQLIFFIHSWKYHNANACFKAVDDCFQCFSRYMSKITSRLNRFAYIQIALRGKNYMQASKDGYRVLQVNVNRYGFLFTVDSILLFMMRLGIALLPTTIFYFMASFWQFAETNILQPIYFVLLIFYFSLGMSTVIVGSFQACIDSLMTCYVIDELVQKQKCSGPPLYPPQEMADLFRFFRL